MCASQAPEATRVAGFNTWKSLGRFVKKGQTGIRILAPLIRKVEEEENGTTERISRPFGFKTVAVFDYAQTDGEPLPELNTNATEGGDALLPRLEKAAAQLNITLVYKAIEGSACRKDTMVVVTYDEFGGQWDHVTPPGQGTTAGPHDLWGPGTRIPALILAPRLPGNFVVDSTQHDTTSILATIEHRFGLAPQRNAIHFLHLMAAQQPRQHQTVQDERSHAEPAFPARGHGIELREHRYANIIARTSKNCCDELCRLC